MPLSALFILFDQTIHNPMLPQTNTYLTLLDIGAGHFSRLDYASQGTVPSSLLAEFSHIARQYHREIQKKETGSDRHRIIQTAHRRETQYGSFDSNGETAQTGAAVSALQPSTTDPQVAASQDSLSVSGFLGSQSRATPTYHISDNNESLAVQQGHQGSDRQQTSTPAKQMGTGAHQDKMALGNFNFMGAQYSSASEMEHFPGALASEEFQLLGIDVMDLFDTRVSLDSTGLARF